MEKFYILIHLDMLIRAEIEVLEKFAKDLKNLAAFRAQLDIVKGLICLKEVLCEER